MSTTEPEMASSARATPTATSTADAAGSGWLLFAGVMMMLVAVVNGIYGIAAIGKSSVFAHDARYVFGDLRTWGWVAVGIAVVQALAALSIWRGNQFGRWVGIATAGASCIGALLSIPAYPFWSLAVVALDVLVIYGLAVYGGRHQTV